MAAQSLEDVMASVANNNLTLKAMQKQIEAEQTSHHVGLMPENPEFEFAYLWGSPNTIGDRIDVSVTQSFEFPTNYVYRARIANLKDQQLQLTYQKQEQELFLEVGKLYYEIVYHNTRIADLEHCLHYLAEISDAYKQKLEAGSVNIFDYNKVKLAELNLQQEMSHSISERDILILELKQLNGNQELNVSVSTFPDLEVAADFDTWYNHLVSNNPILLWLTNQQAVQQQQIKLSKSLWAPQFQAGYMREQIPNETFQGVKVGMTIPLWHNLHSRKQNELQNSALGFLVLDEQQKLYNQLKKNHLMVISLNQQVAEYGQLLSSVDEGGLLQEALQHGELSLIEYLYEMSIYHESHERYAELQRDAAIQFMELQVFEYACRKHE